MEPTRKISLPNPPLDAILEETAAECVFRPTSGRMNGLNSSRNHKNQKNGGPPVTKNHGDIPTLRIQSETPIPNSTRTTPVPQHNGSMEKSIHLPALSSARSLVSNGKPSPRQQNVTPRQNGNQRQPNKQNNNNLLFNRTIKTDNGDADYGPQCIGIRNQLAQNITNFSSSSTSDVHSSSKSSIGQLHIPNQHLETNTPTPSEVSLIQCTPRGNLGTAYSVSSERNSLSTPGAYSTTSDKAIFLEPLPKQQDWTHYKPLPSVTPNGGVGVNSITSSDLEQYAHHGCSISQYQGSISNLSPSQDISMYTSTSLFTSPRNSASIHHRASQKRALSISPSISDFDLNLIIRLSPTSLVGGSRSSSISVSPQLVQPSGSFSHLSARNSPYSNNGSGGHRLSQSHFTANICNRHENANYFNVVPNENNSGYVDLMSNQCVAPLSEIPYIEQNYQAGFISQHGQLHHPNLQVQHLTHYSCMNNGIVNPNMNSVMNSAMNNMNVGQMNSMNNLNSAMVSVLDSSGGVSMPIRPPPPYSQAVEQQQLQQHLQQQQHQQPPPLLPLQPHNMDNYIQNIPTPVSVKNEFGEEETCEEKHFCEWIDCKSSFKEKDDLVRHIEKMHIDQRKGDDFTCFWQGCQRRYKPFNARYKLLIHMRVHSGEKPNKCTFENCDKAFSRLENLKIHLRSHTGERPYVCPQAGCTKAFSNSSDRAKHQRTHQDTKPYACQVPGCTKRYTDPSSLRKHVKNHSQKDQQIKKKLKTEVDINQPDILKDCLKIHQLRSNGSPMDQTTDSGLGRSPHPLSSSSDMYSGMSFGNLSSRLGSTSINSQHSPVSIQHGSPMNTGTSLGVVEESNESMSGYSPNHNMLSPRPLPPIQHSHATLPHQPGLGLPGYNYNYNTELPNPYPHYTAPRNTFLNSNAYTSTNSCRMGMMQAQRDYANYQAYNYDEQNYMAAMNGQQGYMDPLQGPPLESLGITSGGGEDVNLQYLQLTAIDRTNSRTSAPVYAEGTSV